MKRTFFVVVSLFTLLLTTSCISSPKLSDNSKNFTTKTQLSLVVPMRFYTWVKGPYSSKVQPDISSGKLDFIYDESKDILLAIEKTEKGIIASWGKQLLYQPGDHNILLFSSYISSVYALDEGKDPIDAAFSSLTYILNDGLYKDMRSTFNAFYTDALDAYSSGGDDWNSFKHDHFIVKDNTISLIY